MAEFSLFIEQSSGKYWNAFDTVYGDEIVNELSRRKCMDPGAVVQKLHDNDPDDPNYEMAIPVLCGLLAEEDLLQENAAEALVRIGTPEVVTTLKEQYLLNEDERWLILFGELGYADDLLTLTESIYSCCIISGTPHPLLPQWKKELAAREARMAKHSAEMDRMFSSGANKAPKGTYRRLNGNEKTYVNPEPKAGRNDPCPCGSGKKHKKCCGT